MERQEHKKRKVCRNRTQSFPLDLTSEILLRLPEKSVGRFRCVSKLWSSITTDPYFINQFESRSSRPSLILCFRAQDNLFVFSIPQHTHSLHQNPNKSYTFSQPIYHYHMKFPKQHSYLYATESVDGLICFQKSATIMVWNPSTRQLITLPKPKKTCKDFKVFLGHDPVEGKHKVLCLPRNRTCNKCRVLTLGSAQESWRTVKTNHKHRSEFYLKGQCIKGVIYYIAYRYHTRAWVIMSFNVRFEKFDTLELPSNIDTSVLLNYKGKLACYSQNNGIRLWILEDTEKHKWSSKDFSVTIYQYDPSFGTWFKFKGITHDGEFIYVANTFNRSNYILFCDPVRNSFKRFEFKGIADDESLLNNGVRNECLYPLHVLPNHIESRMSL